jgi:hypothetical protein
VVQHSTSRLCSTKEDRGRPIWACQKEQSIQVHCGGMHDGRLI